MLDTSIVSAAMWKMPDPGVLDMLDKHGGECAISAHVWHELRWGVARLKRGKRRDVLEAFLREVVHPTLPILPYDERAAEWLAAERFRLEKAGKHMAVVDGQIAAVAATNGVPVITANVADFASFKGLSVHNWMSQHR
ncbi:MAG: type II toxin-antitoxin system VapC family toxin [Myxococcales bacterium]